MAYEYKLFIDSSKVNLKAVLLHSGNEKLSIPLCHAVGMKQTCQSMELIINGVLYSNHKSNICGDLRVISLILGLKLG